MFKLDKKAYEGNPTTELVANVVQELGKMFDVLSKVILQNKKDINAGILIIGNEVLSGRTQDVNTSTLAIWLNSLGIPVAEVRVIPDDESIIINKSV